MGKKQKPDKAKKHKHQFGRLRIPKHAVIVDFRVNPDVEQREPWDQHELRGQEVEAQ